MALARDADSLAAHQFSALDWPDAPIPVRRLGWRQWILGPLCVALILPLLLPMTVDYFGFDREGRGS